MTLRYSITTVDPQPGVCFAAKTTGKPCNRQLCSHSRELRYRCDAINPDTGEITATTYACVNHAAWLAGLVGHRFPICESAA